MASPSRDQPQAHPSETLRFIERSHESELTRVGRLAHVGRNFPPAYLLMGLPGLLANVPTSRREHAILQHADGRVQRLLGAQIKSFRAPTKHRCDHDLVQTPTQSALPLTCAGRRM